MKTVCAPIGVAAKTAKTIGLALAAMCLSFATVVPQAAAGVFTISTSDGLVSPGRDNQGWWGNGFGNSNATNDNYFTSETSHRSYFTFDLSGVSGVVTSATVSLRRYSTAEGATLSLFDVSTGATALAQRLVADISIFNDLGTGTSYGSFVAGAGTSTDIMSFTLNAAALIDINAALGGYFSIGGTSTGGTHFGGSGREPGNSSENHIQQIVLVTSEDSVPAPGAILLLGLGLLGLAARRQTV